MHKLLPFRKRLRLFPLLLLLIALPFLPQKAAAQTSKQADIQQLMDVMYGNSLVESIVMAMTEAMQLENGAMKREVIDSLRGLLLENVGPLRDSLAGVYDRLYTANEIKEMIKVYQTPIGKRIVETQSELLQQSMAVGRAWGQYHAEEIERRIDPIVAKYRIMDVEQQYGSGQNLAPDPILPVVKNDKGNKRTLDGSKAYKYQLKYNDEEWKFIPAKDMSALADLALVHTEHEIYAMIIAENSTIDLQALRSAALINIHKAAEGVKVKKSALRKVNGKEVLVMMVDCRVDDLQITYYNYYYAGDWGVLQFIVFSDQATMLAQQTVVEALLSGLMVD
jgi:uncharacterized protein